MFRLALLAALFAASPLSVESVGAGQSCRSDSDCDGNLDCQRIRLLKKVCAPVSCAKGAAQAVVDSGFNAEAYLDNVKGKTGLKNRDFATLNDADAKTLSAVTREYTPPVDVFNKNLTACLNPGGSSDVESKATQSDTWYGLMWSAAALFSYFGKSTWSEKEEVRGPGGDSTLQGQLVSNCVGFLAGADVGLDVLFQIRSNDDGNFAPSSLSAENKDFSTTEDVGDSQYVPVITAGPFGIQVGWPADDGPEDGTIFTEIALGPSLGAALGGFNQCFNQATLTCEGPCVGPFF